MNIRHLIPVPKGLLQSYIEIKLKIIMNLTNNNITFLRDVHSSVKVDMTSGWRHHYFDGSLIEIVSFIRLIGDNKIYLLIPLFASSRSFSDATLNLSEPFLVDNKSNPDLIIKFIIEQWKSSIFELKKDTTITFSFKFKRVWFN
uniref:hypothetical protein n=1 Tax=Russula emetica TaxID=152958 RepID=UPI0031F43384